MEQTGKPRLDKATSACSTTTSQSKTIYNSDASNFANEVLLCLNTRKTAPITRVSCSLYGSIQIRFH